MVFLWGGGAGAGGLICCFLIQTFIEKGGTKQSPQKSSSTNG
jgi:hypothetical protein